MLSVRYLWAFDELVAASLPELHEHFCKENLQHSVYLHQWFLPLGLVSVKALEFREKESHIIVCFRLLILFHGAKQR